MPFHSPDLAFAAIIIGFFLGYWELIRPGSVLPGVTGAVLIMLGIASLAGRVQKAGLLLCLAGVALGVVDAHLRLRGVLALAGGAILAIGARQLSAPAIGWATAWILSIPFVWVTNWLLTIALQARANKLSP
jgi:membrane-bound serine protease (ClpP class)